VHVHRGSLIGSGLFVFMIATIRDCVLATVGCNHTPVALSSCPSCHHWRVFEFRLLLFIATLFKLANDTTFVDVMLLV
jgi:hypothetical protein